MAPKLDSRREASPEDDPLDEVGVILLIVLLIMQSSVRRAAGPDLLDEIEAFLGATGMTASTFGLEAMGDKSFVYDLRRGREWRNATEVRAREQMTAYHRRRRFERR